MIFKLIFQKTSTTAFSHLLTPMSTKAFVQKDQNTKKDLLQKYDYGEEGNLKIYGQPDPPIYNLSRVQTPVQGIYSLNDIICVPQVKHFIRI